MRRTMFAVLAGVCLLLAWPTRADAWWGWIDELTGPKGFHGPQEEVRLVCLPPAAKGDTTRGMGAKWSFCDPKSEKKRIVSIAFGSRLFYTTDNAREFDPSAQAYANGHRMYLFTATPLVELRPAGILRQLCSGCADGFNWTDTLDVVDLAVGAGYYRISSEGFNPLQGRVYEWHVTFRAPVALISNKDTRRWAKFIPQYVVGKVGFADGFEANAFGPRLTGPKADAKSPGKTDWTRQHAIFMDLTPFFRH